MTTELDDDGVVFEEPPPLLEGDHTKGVWTDRLEVAALKPGQWARIRVVPLLKTARHAVGNLRRGKYQIPDGAWEFTARLPEGSTKETLGPGLVYARYLGEGRRGKRGFYPKRAGKRQRPLTFWQWLKKHKVSDKGPAGMMAKYARKDKSWPKQGPKANDYATLKAYLAKKAPGGFEPEWFQKAWKEYEEARR